MKTPRHFDAIVIGCGGIGLAATYWLSRELKGNVLGLEQFQIGHVRGESQDYSRVIRLAQHEEPYAAIAPHSYTAWAEAERESAQQLVFKTGGLVIESPEERDPQKVGRRNIPGYVEAFKKFGFDFEQLDAKELMARWPQFHLRGTERAVFQKDTGLVDAARGNAVHYALARARGATILTNTAVESISEKNGIVTVRAGGETYEAPRVVITSGPWTNRVLASFGIELPLTITQEQVTYYATPNLAEFSMARFPVFMWHAKHNFYGFPVYGEVATKLGQHMGGNETTADTRTFDPDPVRVQRQREFLERHIPGFLGPELYTKTCLYTVPPDQNFVIDHVPGHDNIALAIGAGHAYKFAALIGQILSQLVISGKSKFPIDTFRMDRPALTDPDFPRCFHA